MKKLVIAAALAGLAAATLTGCGSAGTSSVVDTVRIIPLPNNRNVECVIGTDMAGASAAVSCNWPGATK